MKLLDKLVGDFIRENSEPEHIRVVCRTCKGKGEVDCAWCGGDGKTTFWAGMGRPWGEESQGSTPCPRTETCGPCAGWGYEDISPDDWEGETIVSRLSGIEEV